MAWLNNIVNFVRDGIDDFKKLWINGAQKISNMAFDENVFYDVAGNVAGKKGGKNGFVMLNEARDTMRDQLDTMSLKLYNNKYSVKSQEELEQAFSNMYDVDFRKRMFMQQIYAAEKEKGLFGDMYSNFDFSNMGKNLTKEQRQTLMETFMDDYDNRLSDIYSAYVPDNMVLSKNAKLNARGQSLDQKAWIERFEGEWVENGDIIEDFASTSNKASGSIGSAGSVAPDTGLSTTSTAVDVPLREYGTGGRRALNGQSVPLLGGPSTTNNTVREAIDIHERAKDLNFNYGMQKRYINDNVAVLDFATSDTVDISGINKEISGSRYAKDLNAYRSFLNKKLMNVPDKNGTWSNPENIYDYFTKKGYTAEDAENIRREYDKLISKRISSGNPDHSGIDIWGMAKRHPVIATSIVMGTTFGISELTEDDSL